MNRIRAIAGARPSQTEVRAGPACTVLRGRWPLSTRVAYRSRMGLSELGRRSSDVRTSSRSATARLDVLLEGRYDRSGAAGHEHVGWVGHGSRAESTRPTHANLQVNLRFRDTQPPP